MPRPSKPQSPSITIVGAGTLATALAIELHENGYHIAEIVSRDPVSSLRRARLLAKQVSARAVALKDVRLGSRIVWLCVPDSAITSVAEHLAARGEWNNRIALHSSGALASNELAPLRSAGAHVAAAHPLMTFVHASRASLTGVPFALEGDRKALAVAAALVRGIGGKPFRIAAKFKPAYHLFGFFSSPAIAALVAAAQEVGKLAGLSERRAAELMEPIVRQTVDNCFRHSAQAAFSGPLRRGDSLTIRKHLKVLSAHPELLNLYCALSDIALRKLPTKNIKEIKKAIDR